MTDLPTLELFDIQETEQVAQMLSDWDLCSTQLGPGRQESFHHQLIFDDLHIVHFMESRAIAYEMRPPSDTTAFFIFTPKSPLERWCGIEVPHDVSLIHPGGRDYVAYYPPGFVSIGLLASNELLEKLEILPTRQTRNCEISTEWLSPMTEAGRPFTRWLYRVFESAVNLRLISRDPVASTLFREQVLQGLAVLLEQDARMRNRPVVTSTLRRYGLTSRALELIDRRLTERLSTQDIASQLEVSPRVLQFAFRDVLQTSPYDFVLKKKLLAVRQQLLDQTAAESRVTDVAMMYGFTELGRFSQRYQQMFDELPSTTARTPSRLRYG